jgi:tRNA pseudouridine-54 N-methylase
MHPEVIMSSKREQKRTVIVEVDEKKIPLNPYVQDVFSEITLALLKTLKKTEDDLEAASIKVTIAPLS